MYYDAYVLEKIYFISNISFYILWPIYVLTFIFKNSGCLWLLFSL